MLDCSPLQWVSMDVMPAPSHASPGQLPRWPVWLALDEVTDPVSPLGAASCRPLQRHASAVLISGGSPSFLGMHVMVATAQSTAGAYTSASAPCHQQARHHAAACLSIAGLRLTCAAVGPLWSGSPVLLCAQQNLGSLVRSAYYMGVAGVLCCSRNSAPLSATVSKAGPKQSS